MKTSLFFLLANLMVCTAQAFTFRCAAAGPNNCDTDNGVHCCTPDFTACAECCMDSHCPPTFDPAVADLIYCVDQLCVECRNDRDCAIPTPICDDTGACIPECIDDADCALFPNTVCDVANGICVCSTDMDRCNGFQEVCNADGNCDCETGFVRDTFDRCVADCDPECPTNRTCARDGTCICAPGFAVSANGGCDPCIPDCDPECSQLEVCANGQCICGPGYVRDNATNTCIRCRPECTQDSDCENEGECCNEFNQCACHSNEKLFKGSCVGQGLLGGQCLNGICKGRNVRCNRTTNMCMCQPNCKAHTVCLKKPTKGPKKW